MLSWPLRATDGKRPKLLRGIEPSQILLNAILSAQTELVLNELLIGSALPAPACFSRQPPHLIPDSRLLKIRRMNADPNQRSTSQPECQVAIPSETGCRAPGRASAPNQRLRPNIIGAAEGLHPSQSGRVEKA